jgi:hypothetical protein
MSVGKVIGWKFNSQEGMVTVGGVIKEFPSGVDGVDYVDGIPSDANIATWTNEYNAHVTATAYIAKRVAQFPTIGDQLDKLFHDMTAGKGDKTGEWYKAINKIKTDNPK